MKFRTILLFGAPGSGKGTQGKILGAVPGYYHCSCGDVFRSLKLDSPLGQEFVAYSSRGALVPDGPTVELWQRCIEGVRKTGGFDGANDTLILDGIPRNRRQAELLEDAIDVRALIYLTCPNEEQLVRRLQRRALKENRLDDANLETIRERFRTYENQSRPVLDFYRPERLHTVDAAQSPLDVLWEVIEIVRGLANE